MVWVLTPRYLLVMSADLGEDLPDSSSPSTSAPNLESPALPVSPLVLRFRRLSLAALPPIRASPGAAGYDLCSAVNHAVPPHSRSVIPTDLSFQFPPGCYGRLAPRSGLAAKFFIDVGAGVIDPDFRGNVSVVIFNFSDHCFNISRGDRICQLIVERHCTPDLEETDDLTDTQRGAGGFGSTGTSFDPKTEERKSALLSWLKQR